MKTKQIYIYIFFLKELPALPYANIEELKQEAKQQIPSGALKKRVSISDKLINMNCT